MVKTIYNGEYEKKAITDQFVENLGEMLEKDTDVIYLDADLMFAFGAGLWELGDKFPKRVIRCGIAEANMVGTAAAMSVMGMKPIIHSFASFVTRRAFDQIFLSGAYGRKTLNIIGSEPGYKQTYWGGTHMAFEDIAMMREAYNQRRRYLMHAFKEMGLQCFEPYGAFYVFPCIKEFGMTNDEFAERLLREEKVVVVPGTAFGDCGEGFLRISYAYSLENLQIAMEKIEAFIKRLREEKNGHKS